MTASNLIVFVLAGGVLGMLGQAIRVLVGIRKMNMRQQIFEASRMFVSLVVGFTAGALGILVMHFQGEVRELDVQDIILLISIGYSGVDFIEGFYRTVLNKQPNPTASGVSVEVPQKVNSPNGPSQVPQHLNHHHLPVTEHHNGQTVKIKYGLHAKPETISIYALDVIKELLEHSNNYSATITSTARSPKDQARAMFNNLIASPDSVAQQKTLYGPYGDLVIDAFVAAKKKQKSKKEILLAMEAKIIELGPGKVSKHCADFNKLVVVDIAPSSIKNKEAFITSVDSDIRVSRFFAPPKDPAYHLEIPNEVGDAILV